MALRILGLNGGATIAESTNDKPVCRYCDWLTLEQIVLAGCSRERTLFMIDLVDCGAPSQLSPRRR
jgi:hypothetical protein